MPQYQIRVQRVITTVIEAPSVLDAAAVAQNMVLRDPGLKLLDVVRTDLIEPEEITYEHA